MNHLFIFAGLFGLLAFNWPERGKPKPGSVAVDKLQDPIAVLNYPKSLDWPEGGKLKPEEFRDAKGITLNLKDCPSCDTSVQIAEFTLVLVPRRGDPVEVTNRQADFNDSAKRLIANAVPGDTYYFDTIKAHKTGPLAEGGFMKLNSLVFKIE